MSEQEIKEGDVIRFLGFTAEEEDDRPEGWEALTEDEQYTVVGILPADDENPDPAYLVEAPNPDFDSSKRASKKNPKVISIDVFPDEVELVEAEDENEAGEETEAPAKGKAKRTAKAGGKGKATRTKGKASDKAAADEARAAERASTAQDPDLKGMILLNESEEDPEIVSLIGETDDIVGLLKELAEQQANAEWRLGGVLYHARVSKDYADDERYAAKGGFALWCEEVLGLEYRKAMYLCNIYATFRRHGLGADDLNEMGWGKATKILSVMDSVEDTAELVSAAKEQTSTELAETIKATQSSVTTGGTKQTVRKIQFKFSLTEEQAYLIRELWEMGKEQEGEEDDNLMFEKVVSEWAESHLGVGDMTNVKRKATRKLNADRKERGEAPVKGGKAKAPTKSDGEAKEDGAKAPAKGKAKGSTGTAKKTAPAKKAPAKPKAKVRRTAKK